MTSLKTGALLACFTLGAMSFAAGGELPLVNPSFEMERTTKVGDLPHGWKAVGNGMRCLNATAYGYKSGQHGLDGNQVTFATESHDITGDGLSQVVRGVKVDDGTDYTVIVGVGTRNFPDRFAGLTIDLGVQGGAVFGSLVYGTDQINALMKNAASGHQVVEVRGVISSGDVNNEGDLQIVLKAGGGNGGSAGRQSLDIDHVRVLCSGELPSSAWPAVLSTLPTDNKGNLDGPIGQTFVTTGGGVLTSVTLSGADTITDIDKNKGVDGSIMVRIREDDDGVASTWDPGRVLSSSEVKSLVHDGYQLTTFHFDQSVPLSAGRTYAIEVLGGDGRPGGRRVGLVKSGARPDWKLFSNGRPAFNDDVDLAMRLNIGGADGQVTLLSNLPATDGASFDAPCGQTFTAERSFEIATIEIAGAKATNTRDGVYHRPFGVVLFEDRDGDPTTWTPGRELGRTDSGKLVHDGRTTTKFSFSRPVALDEGKVYLMKFVSPSGEDANVRFGVAADSPSVGGMVFHKGQLIFDSKLDLGFQLIGSAGGEPVTSSVVMVNGLSLELRRK